MDSVDRSFTGVTLSNLSCNLSRFDDHVRLKKHFYWLVPQTVASQVAGQMLHCGMLKRNSLQPCWKVQLNSTFRNGFCKWSRNVFGRCKVCYIGQRFEQLVSQWRCETSCTKNCTVQERYKVAAKGLNNAIGVPGSAVGEDSVTGKDGAMDSVTGATAEDEDSEDSDEDTVNEIAEEDTDDNGDTEAFSVVEREFVAVSETDKDTEAVTAVDNDTEAVWAAEEDTVVDEEDNEAVSDAIVEDSDCVIEDEEETDVDDDIEAVSVVDKDSDAVSATDADTEADKAVDKDTETVRATEEEINVDDDAEPILVVNKDSVALSPADEDAEADEAMDEDAEAVRAAEEDIDVDKDDNEFVLDVE